METKEITINGEVYVPKNSVALELADKFAGMEYCIVRTYSASPFAGYVESRNGKEVVLRKARRLWQWSGAASLSQLAMEGVKNPEGCKFPCEVDKVILTEAIEIISVTKQAQESIANVSVWETKEEDYN